MGPWGQESKHGDIGGHGARSHGAMEASVAGAAERAEQAERGGHALGPFKVI